MSSMPSPFINDDLPHHTAVVGLLSQPSQQDPYRYQHGFGNHHASEAFPGALPRGGTNLPQKHPYGLYAEHFNGTSFVSSRDSVSNVYVTLSPSSPRVQSQPYDADMEGLHSWMYRVRPSVAHRPLQPRVMNAEV